jgi:hypothetical protein
MTDFEQLRQMYDDQRAELGFRRAREQQIFTWSSAALLAIIGGLLAFSDVSASLARLGLAGEIIAALLVAALAIYSAMWQRKQRTLMRRHQWVLAQLAVKRGWFSRLDAAEKNPLFPADWKRWGSSDGAGPLGGKFWATIVLGLVAVGVVICTAV